jgi:hypothetical protein
MFTLEIRPISDAWLNADEQQKERLLNLLVAAGLFMASLLFVEAIRRVASLELGGHDPLPGSLQGMCRWDCLWYETITNAGYHLKPMFHANGDAANWAFFPAFPIVASVVRAVTGASASQALVMTSKLSFFISIFVFIGYSQRILGRKGGWLAGTVLAMSPYAIYAHAGYTESLYFLLTTTAFWLLERKAWIASGLAGGLMGATRIIGIAFGFAYLATLTRKSSLEEIRRDRLAYLVGLLLIPSGLAGYMYYLYFHVGDALAFKHVMLAWGRSSANLLDSLRGAMGWELWGPYFALIAFLGLLSAGWHLARGRHDMAAYMGVSVLVPLMSSVGSMPRYVFWQMPFLLAVAEIASRQRGVLQAYLVFASAMGTIMVTAWFSGNVFVV